MAYAPETIAGDLRQSSLIPWANLTPLFYCNVLLQNFQSYRQQYQSRNW